MKILFATDGSDCARAAGDFLAALPWPAGTRIEVVCVADPFIESLLETVSPRQQDRAARVVEAAARALRRPAVEITTRVRAGEVACEILRAAEEAGADL